MNSSPCAVQPCLCCTALSFTLCLSPLGCRALSPVTTSDPVFHATRSLDHLLVPKRWMLPVFLSFPKCSHGHWDQQLELLGSTSKRPCYKLSEVTISLLTIVFRYFINGTRKAIFYREDHPKARKLFCGAFMSRSISSSLLVLWV